MSEDNVNYTPVTSSVETNTGQQQYSSVANTGLTVPQKTLVKAWWKKVTATTKVENKLSGTADKNVFGSPLSQSIQYAYSTISYHDDITDTPCMAVIPTIIAKCGSYLKENGLMVEGIFRLSGSSKRIGHLQALFDTADNQYGIYLGWHGFNVHDAANVMRRFLNHLPEPVIPLAYYQQFKKTMVTSFPDEDVKIQSFQNLIGQMPLVHQFLLLYLLDLLSLFALTSHLTRMDIPCLASVFAPGILSHPDDALNPSGYKESQLVLEYLIQHQDKFKMPSSGIPFIKSECLLRPLPEAPPMQHSLSSPPDMLFTFNDSNNNIHPLHAPKSVTAPSSPSIFHTKSMTSLPLPSTSISSPSSKPSFYANPLSSKSMIQVYRQQQQQQQGRQEEEDNSSSVFLASNISSTPSMGSVSVRRNKTLPSKNSLLLSSTASLHVPTNNNSNKPSWLDRSITGTSATIKRGRQHSMPIANQKTSVRRWKSIRTVPAMERDDLTTTPIFTQ